MKNHLFRLARVLIGRDPAILVRDNPTWFRRAFCGTVRTGGSTEHKTGRTARVVDLG